MPCLWTGGLSSCSEYRGGYNGLGEDIHEMGRGSSKPRAKIPAVVPSENEPFIPTKKLVDPMDVLKDGALYLTPDHDLVVADCEAGGSFGWWKLTRVEAPKTVFAVEPDGRVRELVGENKGAWMPWTLRDFEPIDPRHDRKAMHQLLSKGSGFDVNEIRKRMDKHRA